MSDTRPLMLGYVRAADHSTDREIAQHTVDLAVYADCAGYALGAVFVQSTDWSPAAFDALMSEAARTGAAVLLAGSEPQLLQCDWAHEPAAPETLIAV